MTRPVVLVAIKGLGVGGAEKLIAESARVWDRDHFEYHVAYALRWKDQLVPQLESLEVPVRCIGTRRGMTPRAWWNLRRHASAIGADLVHAHLPAMGAVARLAVSVPVVYTEHNVAGSYRGPVRLVNRLTYRGNRAVTAVSQAVADSVTGYPGPSVRLVSNGVRCEVTPDESAAARAELGVGPETPLVVHVGNIRPHKGHAVLVQAVAALSSLVPGVRVVSIGGEKHDGDLDRVRRLASEAGVAQTLCFLGRREDALSFVAAADVFANPSDFEGLPVAILEAMALERPVVATAVGGVPSVVTDSETGLLVPPGDPEALAEALARLLLDPVVAADLGAAGRKVVERDFGLEAMVRMFEAMYEEVLGG